MQRHLTAVVACVAMAACTSRVETRARQAPNFPLNSIPLVQDENQLSAPRRPERPFDGRLVSYQRFARRHSARLRQRFAEWQAAVLRIDAVRVLPEPTVRYTAFLRSVETRVGPQRHRLGVSQMIPWPTTITAGIEGASHQALAASRRFDAEALRIDVSVADAYWQLWLLEHRERTLNEQLVLLKALSDAARARIEVGNAGLAHLVRVQLEVTRLDDRRRALERPRVRFESQLRRFLNVSDDTALPVLDAAPQLRRVGEEAVALRTSLQQHPALEEAMLLANAKEATAMVEEGKGMPRLTLGVDWIEVGPARAGAPADSGKDAVMLGAALSIPLWRGAYAARRDAALAERRAWLARREDIEREAAAALATTMVDIAETLRQQRVYRTTALYQAQAALEATLGEYQVGQSDLSAVLLAQRELLAVQLQHDKTVAEHQQAWARLEMLVGRRVRAAEEVSP